MVDCCVVLSDSFTVDCVAVIVWCLFDLIVWLLFWGACVGFRLLLCFCLRFVCGGVVC